MQETILHIFVTHQPFNLNSEVPLLWRRWKSDNCTTLTCSGIVKVTWLVITKCCPIPAYTILNPRSLSHSSIYQLTPLKSLRVQGTLGLGLVLFKSLQHLGDYVWETQQNNKRDWWVGNTRRKSSCRHTQSNQQRQQSFLLCTAARRNSLSSCKHKKMYTGCVLNHSPFSILCITFSVQLYLEFVFCQKIPTTEWKNVCEFRETDLSIHIWIAETFSIHVIHSLCHSGCTSAFAARFCFAS